jgi:hypothetical protein
LTHLELLPEQTWCNYLDNWKLWTPAVHCLTAFPRSWSNSLVRLDLKRVNGLPRFLSEAGKVAWPNLKTLVLLGEVNSKDKSDTELQAMNQKTCTALARGLSTMLPKTPNISTILIEMHDFSWNFDTGSFRFQFCLGDPVHGAKASYGPPCSFASCSYKFVPSHVRTFPLLLPPPLFQTLECFKTYHFKISSNRLTRTRTRAHWSWPVPTSQAMLRRSCNTLFGNSRART